MPSPSNMARAGRPTRVVSLASRMRASPVTSLKHHMTRSATSTRSCVLEYSTGVWGGLCAAAGRAEQRSKWSVVAWLPEQCATNCLCLCGLRGRAASRVTRGDSELGRVDQAHTSTGADTSGSVTKMAVSQSRQRRYGVGVYSILQWTSASISLTRRENKECRQEAKAWLRWTPRACIHDRGRMGSCSAGLLRSPVHELDGPTRTPRDLDVFCRTRAPVPSTGSKN
ncbi:hypothetical protein BDA96_02G295600 [Sorghum bicolor]|uniref:Uncharacterized protein n=1 Tax=Sorghum bicolor TaxID=4558 RepID=A0A921RQC3_SORBI|nr:hypothetical protein BDA96_02G295600 [Sorghum bicolor]